jgi:hypothetical protein
MSHAFSILSAYMAVERHLVPSSSVTLVQPFYNFSIHSLTLHCSKMLFPDSAESLGVWPLIHLPTQKPDHLMLLHFGANRKRSSHNLGYGSGPSNIKPVL